MSDGIEPVGDLRGGGGSSLIGRIAESGEGAGQDQHGQQEFASRYGTLLESADTSSLTRFRRSFYNRIGELLFEELGGDERLSATQRIRVRDCAAALRSMLLPRSARVAGFDVAAVLLDVAGGVDRDDLSPAFWADLSAIFAGLLGHCEHISPEEDDIFEALEGREAAVARSEALDALWDRLENAHANYPDGLSESTRARREARKRAILEALGAGERDWADWRWQRDHVITTASVLSKVASIDPEQLDLVTRARRGRLPFGVTPHYVSLFDDDPDAGRDRAVRAQVLPPRRYVERMIAHRDRPGDLDFMREGDTSPIDLVTRRYPGIVILKPYNTCPQICVYCQRNWEIDDVLACNAMASEEAIDAAIRWIAERPAIREVLVTGGDPLTMEDAEVESILGRVAAIPHVEMIRIGTRTPVTLPMRITEHLASILGGLRDPGRRDVAVVTHFEHPYEVTPDSVAAVNRLRLQGIGVYNQLVYNFFVSRRFEATRLRMLLRRIGVDPYYTFVPKGKEETADYMVPLARVLQEQKEEARLLPGIRRTDEPVYNVPGLGKNHIRAVQHRDLLAILPSGSRCYEFHPWEKNIVEREPYLAHGTPILAYLDHLAEIGEDPEDYASIWYYF